MVLQLRRKEELNISGFNFEDKSNVVLYGKAQFMHGIVYIPHRSTKKEFYCVSVAKVGLGKFSN